MAAGLSTSQAGQIARITTTLGADVVFLEGFTFTESLGEPFRLTCDVVCAARYVFGDQRGTGVSIEVTSDIGEGAQLQDRAFHGVLTEAVLVEASEGEYRYRLTVRPWFWVLSLGRDCRIFPNKTARQIITDVFTAAGVPTGQYDLSGLSDRGTIVREYCVQFEESDFAFVSRLMEEEGIYYYFAHTPTSHTMKLCDAPGAHPVFDKGDLLVAEGLSTLDAPHLRAFHSYLRPSVAAYALRDQHWKLFGDMRDASAELDGVVGEIKPKIFEYPGGFSYLTDDGATPGADFAKIRLEAENAESLVYVGEGTTFAVPTGSSVDITWGGQTAKVLVIGATHRLSGQVPLGQDAPRTEYSVEIETISVEKPFRAQRLTPKPFARGPQVATVVGESGKEVDPDAAGRVRVQFPWDRSGRVNEACSCWIRVSSSWAGPGLGETFLPRIGHEVLISYIDGDMDRPVITGRVYDSKNALYGDAGGAQLALPASNATSGWVTQTIGGKATQDYDGAVDPPTDEPGFNFLLFSDKSGKETVAVRAQRDYLFNTYRDMSHRVHRDSHEGVGRHLVYEVQTGNETHKVTKGKRTTTINQDDVLTVEQGAHTTTVSTGDQSNTVSKGDQSNTVSKGDRTNTISMGGDTNTVSLGDITIDASAGNISISAAQSIELKVGPSSIKLDPSGVTIKGMMIMSDATAMGTVKAGAILTLQGALTKIN